MKTSDTAVLLLVTLIFTSAGSTFGQEGESCTTPDFKPGECINLVQCPTLMALLTQSRPLPADVLDFLRRSQCGFIGNNPLVCCPLSTPTTSRITTETPQTPVELPPDVSNHANLRLLPLNICGSSLINRIVNGNATGLFEYPWMALIGYTRATSNTVFYRCGGSIINEKYILTAAHCLVNLPNRMKLAGVRLGEHDMSTDIDCMKNEEGEEECAEPYVDFDIEASIPHPSYSTTHLQNDIGLIRIRGTANFRSESIKPICLPIGRDQTRNLDGQKLRVSGWGATEKGISSPVLLQVEVPVMTQAMCSAVYNRSAASYKNPIKITARQLCAGGENAQDSCDGDSGGPLMSRGEVNSRPRYVQYGIVSFGPRSCGIKGFPGVYTRVAFFVDWILNNMTP